jgi:hypothetical protein
LQQLNVEKVRNQTLVLSHTQETARNHNSLWPFLLKLLPRHVDFALLIPVHPLREQFPQLVDVSNIDLHGI